MKQLTLKKSFLFIVLITLLSLGCKDVPKEEVIEEKVDVTAISDADFNTLWKKIDALWEQRDPALIHTVYADTFTRAATGGTSTSSEELTNELNAVGKAFPGMKLNLVSYKIAGNMVSVIWTVDGNFTGEIAGLKGNGKPYSVKGITVLTIENGKVVNDDSFWDTFAVFGQTGGYGIVEVAPTEIK
ncbi:ester cyclase [Seonamhaeicola maritimus]|uniref:ester cyclase n=1 Tax=Seonamhaeicola maritimus TaxID=2591822 RepID=UPI002494D5E7|nr:ester cyclase [Seonamhaeicola maritimus]